MPINKNELVDAVIEFVDGCKGSVSGRLEKFAMVRSFPNQPHNHCHEYAWQTVANIVGKGDKFDTR